MKIIFFLVSLALVGCSGAKVKTDAESKDTAEKKEEASSTEKKSPPENNSSATTSQASSTSTSGPLNCTLDKDTRVIEIASAGEGCEVKYTKFGETNSIASSIRGTDHCVAVKDRMKGNLEQAGYKCE